MSPSYRHTSRSLYRAECFRLGLAVAAHAPRGCLRLAARLAGTAYAWTHPSRARVLRRHVAAVTGPAPPPPARAIYASFAAVLADYFYAGARGDRAIEAMCGERRGYELLHAAAEAGRGALLATLHFGFFELGGWVLGRARIPALALTRPEPSPELTAWRAEFRKRWGVDTLEVGRDPRALVEAYQALREGRMVAALIDRPHPRERVAVDLPGGRAGCSATLLKLAAKAGSPILPLTVHLGPGGRYLFHVMEPVRAGEEVLRDERALAACAREVWARLLPLVRAHPEQYYQFEDMEKGEKSEVRTPDAEG